MNTNQFKRAKLFLDGNYEKITIHGEFDEANLLFPAIVIENPNQDALVLKEELFCPILVIINNKNFFESLNFVRKLPSPLTTYYFGKIKTPEYWNILKQISTGSF